MQYCLFLVERFVRQDFLSLSIENLHNIKIFKQAIYSEPSLI